MPRAIGKTAAFMAVPAYDLSAVNWRKTMAEPSTCEEIGLRLSDLACEYSQTLNDDPRHIEIENEISALCLQRYILQRLIDRDRREH